MRYHFHCTDGRDLILDRRGRSLRADGDTQRQAEAVARRLMAELLIAADWRRWMVCIHNEFGEQVDIVPFPQTSWADQEWKTISGYSNSARRLILRGGMNDNPVR
jgi:hypothetical protein